MWFEVIYIDGKWEHDHTLPLYFSITRVEMLVHHLQVASRRNRFLFVRLHFVFALISKWKTKTDIIRNQAAIYLIPDALLYFNSQFGIQSFHMENGDVAVVYGICDAGNIFHMRFIRITYLCIYYSISRAKCASLHDKMTKYTMAFQYLSATLYDGILENSDSHVFNSRSSSNNNKLNSRRFVCFALQCKSRMTPMTSISVYSVNRISRVVVVGINFCSLHCVRKWQKCSCWFRILCFSSDKFLSHTGKYVPWPHKQFRMGNGNGGGSDGAVGSSQQTRTNDINATNTYSSQSQWERV